ncbi:DEAD/DEAH box helicase [Penicillium sp. DV-2018c]|nr:DEAD/DEAH box helicase [Penicillium sp. DV-2018c]
MWPPDPNTQRKWSSERLREDLKSETRRALNAAIDLAAYRDIAIGISQRYLRYSSQFPNNVRTDDRNAEGQDDMRDGADMMDEEWAGNADLQAASPLLVAGMTHRFADMGHRSHIAQRRLMFLLSSTDWHRFLGFACGDSAPLHPQIRSPPCRASPDFRPAPSTTLSAVQLGKRPAADQPEERTPQRARITKRVIRDLEGQEQERQRSLISSQQSEQTQQPMGPEEHFLEEQVAQWALRCFLCQQRGKPHHHALKRCSEPGHREARQWMLDVGEEIQNHWDKHCGCYQCGLPQTICKTFQAGEPCKYGSVIISAIAMMAFGPRPPQSIAERVRKAWERRLHEEHGVWIGDREALARHLGSKNGNEEVFTLVAEFLWLLWAWRSRGKELK